MIRLNVRLGDSTVRFGAPTWLNANNKPIPADVVTRMLVGARVCVLIHGYNVVKALDAYARVVLNIDDLYDVVIGVTWPGSRVEIGYWMAEKRADTAGRMVAEILSALPYKSLDVEGHSCGCRVALEAVRCGLEVRHLILAAAAVDNETVHFDQKYGPAIVKNVELVLVAHSRNDGVLKRAFRASSWLKRLARLKLWGDDCYALGYTGPQDPAKTPLNVNSVDLSDAISDHSEYKESELFYAAWRAMAKAE